MRSLRRLAILVLGVVAFAALSWSGVVGINTATHPSTESRSMSHSEGTTRGVLDPGDTAKVMRVGARDDLVTYYGGRESGHAVAGDWGDVASYRPNGDSVLYTDKENHFVILHRVMAWVVYNASVDAFDVPELGMRGVRVLELPEVGTWRRDLGAYVHEPLVVELDPDLAGRHDGYLMKGDYNPYADQDARVGFDPYGPVELVRPEWVTEKVLKVIDKDSLLFSSLVAVGVAVGGGVVWLAWGDRFRAGVRASQRAVGGCGSCGRRLRAGDAFCLRCGESRAEAASPRSGR